MDVQVYVPFSRPEPLFNAKEITRLDHKCSKWRLISSWRRLQLRACGLGIGSEYTTIIETTSRRRIDIGRRKRGSSSDNLKQGRASTSTS